MDKRQFAEAMTLTAAAFDKELTESLLKVYWEDLQEFEFEEFTAALTKIRRTSKWFPKIAEIRELLVPAEPDLEQIAIAEWDSVRAMLKDSRSAKSDNLITDRVVRDLGGYWRLGQMSQDELKWQQKEFVRRWVMHEDTTVAPINRRIGSGPTRISDMTDGAA